jgi:hypothetical protein
MPVIVQNGGEYFFLIGGAIALGDIADVDRLPIITGYQATSAIIPPVTGHIAILQPEVISLIITQSIVTDSLGHTVTLLVANNPAPIFYTLNTLDPLETDIRYIDPIRIEGAEGTFFTLKYKAFALEGSGYEDSAVVEVTLQIPTIVNLTWDVENTIDPLVKNIELTPNVVGDFTIMYTTDGTIPSLVNGTEYTAEFQVSGTMVGDQVPVKAIAFPNSAPGLVGGVLQSDLESLVVTF